MKKFIALALSLLLCFSLATVETINYYGALQKENDGFKSFVHKHPEVTMNQLQSGYNDGTLMIGQMISRNFQGDLLNFGTEMFTLEDFMRQGYFVDLSNDKIIAEAVSRMHPHIAQQCYYDGKLLCVPSGITFNYLSINKDAWFAAGFTYDDVPDSFPKFLDFLNDWCSAIESGEEPSARIYSGFDSFYSSDSYVAFLINLLVDQYITQCSGQEEINFDTETFRTLLHDCILTGRRLYEDEPSINQTFGPGTSLFVRNPALKWPDDIGEVVFLRTDDSFPKSITAYLDVYAVYSGSPNIGKTLSLVEALVTGPEPETLWFDELFYVDAAPKLNNNYERSVTSTTSRLEQKRALLQTLDPDSEEYRSTVAEIDNLEKNLAYYEEPSYKYHISEKQLQEYTAFVDNLYFPKPSPFQSAPGGVDMLEDLKKRVAQGQCSEDEFIKELNRIAQMLQLENS